MVEHSPYTRAAGGSNPPIPIGQLVQWLERVVDIDEVGGPIPPLPIRKNIWIR